MLSKIYDKCLNLNYMGVNNECVLSVQIYNSPYSDIKNIVDDGILYRCVMELKDDRHIYGGTGALMHAFNFLADTPKNNSRLYSSLEKLNCTFLVDNYKNLYDVFDENLNKAIESATMSTGGEFGSNYEMSRIVASILLDIYPQHSFRDILSPLDLHTFGKNAIIVYNVFEEYICRSISSQRNHIDVDIHNRSVCVCSNNDVLADIKADDFNYGLVISNVEKNLKNKKI